MNVININCMIFWFLQINAGLRAKKSAMRVVGGQAGDPETHQYIVRMEMKVKRPQDDLVTSHHICTATVITPVWVLTAAHCIEYFEGFQPRSSLKNWNVTGVIRYGSVTPETNGTSSDILAMQKHPLYMMFKLAGGDSMRHDIGLMKTAPIHLDKYGKLSAVDYKTLSGHAAVAAGYGGHKLSAENDDSAVRLLRDTLQLMDVLLRNCETVLNNLVPAICLSRRCGHIASICPGDSGGPLLHPSGVVGVNSKSSIHDCYVKIKMRWFAIDTPVSPYIEWIKNHIKQNGMT